jgi:hypothetical protein
MKRINNIRQIREQLGSGPVRREAPAPAKKQAIGPKEAQARRDREEMLKNKPDC